MVERMLEMLDDVVEILNGCEKCGETGVALYCPSCRGKNRSECRNHEPCCETFCSCVFGRDAAKQYGAQLEKLK